ncbi:hypothetical protein [Agriterribacter humi]|uniref:hypothetical protein n=1 Tax=Agriterribacter humi TaxID=1104781 RepID=UPI00186B2CC4|nr:hypothetical protein [Agriterribacter humi]
MENKKHGKKGKPEFPDIKKIEKNIHPGSKKITEVPETPDDIPYKKSPEEVPDITPDETDKNLDDPDIDSDPDADVTPDERKDLANAAEKMPTDDENVLRRAKLDITDDEGELLNEGSGLSGSDLDVPGSEADDADEEIGEEDEENNSFSTDNETEDRNKDIE